MVMGPGGGPERTGRTGTAVIGARQTAGGVCVSVCLCMQGVGGSPLCSCTLSFRPKIPLKL